MNLSEQATQPSKTEYRTCHKCGIVFQIKHRKRKQRFCSRKCATARIPNNPDPTPEEVAEGIRRIELTQGQFAIIDTADYEWVNQWAWFAARVKTGNFYAVRGEYDPENLPHKQRRVMMSRAIIDAPLDMWVDHKDRNTLNHRRGNLRLATPTQNCNNRSKAPNKSSKYKGASWCPKQSKWKSFIRVNGKLMYLGLFEEESDAAGAYRDAAIKYLGEFACAPEPSPSVVIS